MELLVLIVVVIFVVALLILALLTTEMALEGGLVGLAINAVLGVLLLFLTNLVVSPPIPINLITLLICAIGGVVGWLIIVVLYILRIAFYVPVVAVFSWGVKTIENPRISTLGSSVNRVNGSPLVAQALELRS